METVENYVKNQRNKVRFLINLLRGCAGSSKRAPELRKSANLGFQRLKAMEEPYLRRDLEERFQVTWSPNGWKCDELIQTQNCEGMRRRECGGCDRLSPLTDPHEIQAVDGEIGRRSDDGWSSLPRFKGAFRRNWILWHVASCAVAKWYRYIPGRAICHGGNT